MSNESEWMTGDPDTPKNFTPYLSEKPPTVNKLVYQIWDRLCKKGTLLKIAEIRAVVNEMKDLGMLKTVTVPATATDTSNREED
jgi:hypothetical protein